MRLRVKYGKTEAGRYLSHLDLARTLERALRRARWPLAFSEGFNPHPKFSFASALAVGVTSGGEYLDVELRERAALPGLKDSLEAALPGALALLDLIEIHGPKRGLSAMINRARYQAALPAADAGNLDIMRAAADDLLESQIYPRIFGISVYVESGQVIFDMLLETGPAGQVKPQDVLALLRDGQGLALPRPWRLHREGLYVQWDGRLYTPIDIAEGSDGSAPGNLNASLR
jgi:radical SAM-linked protein